MNFLILLYSLVAPISAEASAVKCLSLFSKPALERSAQRSEPPQLAEPLQNSDFLVGSLPSMYLQMAQKKALQPQYNEELERRGLIVPDGGLCLSACVTNLLGSLLLQPRQISLFPAGSVNLLENVVSIYSELSGSDARHGAYGYKFTQMIPEIVSRVTQGQWAKDTVADELLFTEYIPAAISSEGLDFILENDSIAIANIRPVERNVFVELGGHAIVILSVNRASKVLYISDPGVPNKIQIRPYNESTRGLTFKLPSAYEDHALMIGHINAFRFARPNFK